MIKYVMIDPYERTVTDGELPSIDLKTMYSLMDCSLIDFVQLHYIGYPDHALVVDDEGYFREPQADIRCFTIKGLNQPFAGKSLFVRCARGEDITSNNLNAAFISQYIDFVGYQEIDLTPKIVIL